MAARGPARNQIAPFIRKSFLDAMDLRCERLNKTPAELIDDEIEQHGLLAVMDKVSKFAERVSNTNITASHEHTGIPDVTDFLREAVQNGQVSHTEVAGEERPLLPH